MRWMLWALVAAIGVGVGAAAVRLAVSESPLPTGIRSAAEPAAEPGDEAVADLAIPGSDAESLFATTLADARPAAVHARAGASSRAFVTDAELDAQIDEELRWTEQALAASRRSSQPRTGAARTGGGPGPAPAASREAVAAATAGASAVALGCEGAGLACLSSAECCPGLACEGGVAGYGTVGRCERPR